MLVHDLIIYLAVCSKNNMQICEKWLKICG
nr:MAG TPA: hypothetical protein [Caudoviricetes sp.]DAO71846.1 MAG TPA: hypothetical protein [Caudoviricetes sp.]